MSECDSPVLQVRCSTRDGPSLTRVRFKTGQRCADCMKLGILRFMVHVSGAIKSKIEYSPEYYLCLRCGRLLNEVRVVYFNLIPCQSQYSSAAPS